MAVGGLGVSEGSIANSTLLLIWCARRSAESSPRSARGRRSALSLGETLLARFLRAPPCGGVPDLDVVVEAGDDYVFLEAGELPKALGDGHPALAVRGRIGGAGEESPLHVALALSGPLLDLARLHVKLLRAPEGEAAVLFAGDEGLVAQLLPKACWEDEAALGVERVLILAEERRSPPVHHFTTTNPSMARQTPPCCTTSRHPTPQRSTSQPHHSKRPCSRDCAGGSARRPPRSHPAGRWCRSGRGRTVPAGGRR